MTLKKTKKQVNGKNFVTYWLVENKVKIAIKPCFKEDYEKLKVLCDLVDYYEE